MNDNQLHYLAKRAYRDRLARAFPSYMNNPKYRIAWDECLAAWDSLSETEREELCVDRAVNCVD